MERAARLADGGDEGDVDGVRAELHAEREQHLGRSPILGERGLVRRSAAAGHARAASPLERSAGWCSRPMARHWGRSRPPSIPREQDWCAPRCLKMSEGSTWLIWGPTTCPVGDPATSDHRCGPHSLWSGSGIRKSAERSSRIGSRIASWSAMRICQQRGIRMTALGRSTKSLRDRPLRRGRRLSAGAVSRLKIVAGGRGALS